MLSSHWRKWLPSFFRSTHWVPYRQPQLHGRRRTTLQLERLEDRLTPSSAMQTAGALAVTLTGSGDSAALFGTDATQGDVTFKNNVGAATPFTGVTSITVTGDNSGGQSLALDDNSGANQMVNLGTTTGNDITVTGTEDVVVSATAGGALTAGGISVSDASIQLAVAAPITTGSDGQTFNNAFGVYNTNLILSSTGTITFGSTIDAAAPGGQSLTISNSSTVSFGGAIGGSKALNALNVSATGALSIDQNIAANSVDFNSSSGGPAGDITFGSGIVISADSQTYQAGNGTGSASVDFTGASSGTFTDTADTANPANFTYEQDAGITDSEATASQYFSGTLTGMNLTLESLANGVNPATDSTTALNVAGTNLTLLAPQDAVYLQANLTLASLVAAATAISPNVAGGATITTTTGGQTYTGLLVPTSDVTFDAAGASTRGTIAVVGDVSPNDTSGGITLIVDGSATATVASTISGVISDNGTSNPTALTVSGGTLTLSGASTYTGDTTLTGGTLQLGSSTVGVTGPTGTGTLILQGGHLQAIGAAQSIANPFTVSGGASISGSLGLTLSGDGLLESTLTVDNNAATTFSGALSGTGGLTTNPGGGPVTFSGTTANSYTGLTLVISGTLDLDKSASARAVAGDLNIFGGGATVTLMNDNQINNSSAAASVTGTFDLGGFSDTIGTLTGGGAVTDNAASGTGTLTVGGTGSVFAGTIQNGATATTSLTVNQTSGTLDLSGATLNIQDFTLTAGTVAAPGAGKTFDVSGNFANSGTFNAGTGTVNFSSSTNMQTLDSGGQSFANIINSGGAGLQLINHALTVTASFTNSAGTFDLNGQNWTMTGATFSNPGNVQLEGTETITGMTQDITQGTWTYVGDDTGTTRTLKNFGATSYFALVIEDENADQDTFQATADLGVAGFFYVIGGTYNANGHMTTVTQLTKVDGGTYLASTAAQNLNGDLSISDTRSPGIFTGSTGIVTVNNLTLDGGTLNAPSTMLNLTGNFTYTRGTFNPDGGAVNFNASGPQQGTFTGNITPGTTGTIAGSMAFFEDRDLSLAFAGSFAQNYSGFNEKWLRGVNNSFGNPWYFIKPNGQLYAWDGTHAALGSTLLTTLDPVYWVYPDLLYNATQETLDYVLKQKLNLRLDASLYLNFFGRDEKWLFGNTNNYGNSWYFIDDAGRFYSWNGTNQAEGTLLAQLDPMYWAQPDLLYNAQPNEMTASIVSNQLQVDRVPNWAGHLVIALTLPGAPSSQIFTLAWVNQPPVLTVSPSGDQTTSGTTPVHMTVSATDLDNNSLTFTATGGNLGLVLQQELGLRFTGNFALNYGGQNEKWLQSRLNDWYFIKPDGTLWKWDSTAHQATGTQAAALDPVYYYHPEMLYAPPAGDIGYALEKDLGLTAPSSSFYLNYGGQNEKWLLGNNGWYFIKPNGQLYKWDGAANRATGTLMATLDPDYYTHIQRLYNAQLGQITVALVGTSLTLTPTAGFIGQFWIFVQVTDGIQTVDDRFQLTVTS